MTREQAKAFVREIDAVCRKYDATIVAEGGRIVAEVENSYSPTALDFDIDDGTCARVFAYEHPEPDDWNNRQVPFTVDKDAS